MFEEYEIQNKQNRNRLIDIEDILIVARWEGSQGDWQTQGKD